MNREMAAVRRGGLAVVAALGLALGGCTALDDLLATVPFFSFMQESPALDPYEAPRDAPPNAVPYAAPGGVPPIARPQSTQANLLALEAEIDNPLPMTPEVIEAGQELFLTHCAVCHGPTGDGRGPVVGQNRLPPIVPPLATGNATTLSDEYIYGVIWVGRGLMPPYGVRVHDLERWQIVNYIRQMQQAAAGGAQPAGSGAAGRE